MQKAKKIYSLVEFFGKSIVLGCFIALSLTSCGPKEKPRSPKLPPQEQSKPVTIEIISEETAELVPVEKKMPSKPSMTDQAHKAVDDMSKTAEDTSKEAQNQTSELKKKLHKAMDDASKSNPDS